MNRAGKWRLLALVVAVMAIICAAMVMPIAFLKSGSHAAHPASVKAKSPATQKASSDKGVSERQQAREKLVALEGADLLEAALDSSQPDVAKVIDTARREGTAPALQLLRKQHRALPLQPFLRRSQEWSTTEAVRAAADDIIQKGFVSGTWPPLPLKMPIDWTADPYRDRSWRFDLHSWKFLDVPLRLSRAQDGARYVAFARSVALDWSRQHLTGASSPDFAWYDMAVGVRANMLAVILDGALRDPSVSDDDLLLLLKVACAHCLELSDPRTLARHTNHGIFQMGGLLSLDATAPELRDSARQRAYADATLAELFSQHFTREGIHKEHSPGYHIMVTTHLGRLLKTGWLSDNTYLNSLFPKAAWDAIWMIHPDGMVANVGDSELVPARERLVHPDDPQVEYVLSEGVRGTKPPMTFQVFKQSGYAAFRSDWNPDSWKKASHLFFTAAFHSRQHKHADDFSFEWSEMGMRLVQDSGSFAYWKNDPRRDYMESTRAHNTVEIDERDYSREAQDAFGSAITDGGQGGGLYYVQADVYRKRYFKTNHRRIVVFNPGRWVAVIDQLRSPADHKYTQWFHFDPSLHMKPEDGGVASLIGDTGRQLRVLPLSVPEGQALEIIRGREKPRLQGWVSLVRAAITPNDAVGFTRKTRDAAFVTLLHICEPNQQVARDVVTMSPTGDAWEVRWKEDGKSVGFRYEVKERVGNLRRIE